MNNKQWKKLLSDRLLKFGVRIIKLAGKLPKTPAGFAIATQIIKAGTSVGANFQEAQDASSRKDFIQKLSISLREARECYYWLMVIKMAKLLIADDINNDITECEEIIAILTSTIKTSKLKL